MAVMTGNATREALEPCPFCGADEDRLVRSVEGEDDYFNVGCEDCDCRTAWFVTQEDAVAAWNRRARTDYDGAEVKARHADDCPWDKTRLTLARKCTCGIADLSTHTAGAGPVGEAVDTVASILASHDGRKYVIGSDLELSEEIVETLTARHVAEPGEVERLTRERDYAVGLKEELTATIKRVWAALGDPGYETLNGLTISEVVAGHVTRAETAEAALAETRAALNRMVTLYEGEFDPETIPPRPDWLASALSTQESSAALADGKEAGE